VQTGHPEQILRHPANDFVKHFIGKKRLHGADRQEALTTVDKVIVENPATALPTRGLAEAMKLMEKKRVDSLLVVDRNNRLLGSVSIYRLLDFYGDESKTLADVMNPVKFAVKTHTPLSVALNLMSDHQLSNVPVIREDNQFVGLITRGSVVSHLAEVYAHRETKGEEHAG
jgi:osmoprotectant transport system ATP-binding protein